MPLLLIQLHYSHSLHLEETESTLCGCFSCFLTGQRSRRIHPKRTRGRSQLSQETLVGQTEEQDQLLPTSVTTESSTSVPIENDSSRMHRSFNRRLDECLGRIVVCLINTGRRPALWIANWFLR